MNLQQFSEEIGLNAKTFLTFEPDEGDEHISVLYPNYMETEPFPTRPRPWLEVLKDMEFIIKHHQKNVNKDLKLVRAKLKELKNEKT